MSEEKKQCDDKFRVERIANSAWDVLYPNSRFTAAYFNSKENAEEYARFKNFMRGYKREKEGRRG